MTNRLRIYWPLALIVSLYLALGTSYSLVVPPFEGYDEEPHFRYVTWLVSHRSLPVLTKGVFGVFHEAWQPPLYYTLGALAFGWIDTSDLSDLTGRHNPYWAYEVGKVGNDNKNNYLHGPWESFPFRKTILALHAVRLLSVAIGAATVVAAYMLVTEVFPTHPYLALGTTALVAFNPQFLYVNGLVTNDSLVVALTAITMLALIRRVRTGWTSRSAMLLGGLAALAILTKLNGLTLLPLIGLAIGIEFWQTRHIRKVSQYLLIVAGIVLLLSGWWFRRNWVLYGDWSSLEYMRDTIGRYDAPLTSGDIRVAINNIYLSYWAFFGANNVPVAAPIYQALRLATGLALIGLLLALYRHRRHIKLEITTVQLLLIVAWAILAGLAVVYYVSGTPNANMGRNLFIAIPALSLLMFLGLVQWCPQGFRPIATWLIVVTMICFAIGCLVFYIAPAYTRPPVMPATDMPSLSQSLSVWHEDKVILRGYELDRADARPGETLEVTLYWEVLQPIEQNYSVFVQLFGREQQNVGQRDTYPGLGNFPTSQWRPGTVVVDTVPVSISPEATAPVLARIDVGLYELETKIRLPTHDALGRDISNTIGAVKLRPWQWPEVKPAQPLVVTFDDGIQLTGHELKADPASDRYNLRLVWQPTARPTANYTIFIQLWDEGEQVAGFDGPPVGGDYPTNWWEAGEVILDEHPLDLSGVSTGRYRLLVGLYRPDTGERLPAAGPDGPLPDYALELPELWIE